MISLMLKPKPIRKISWYLSLALLALVWLGGERAEAQIGPIVVNSTADSLIPGDNNCTLREAIINANTDSDITNGDCAAGNAFGLADAIDLPNGTFTLEIPGRQEEDAMTGDLDIRGKVLIKGNGRQNTIIEAGTTPDNGIDRVFHVHSVDVPDNSVEIRDVTIRHGRLPTGLEIISPLGDGAGIFNSATLLTIRNSTVSYNTANEHGGGIFNDASDDEHATLVLTNSTVSHNTTGQLDQSHEGGGIYNQGDLVLDDSVVSHNSGVSAGGGIFNRGPNSEGLEHPPPADTIGRLLVVDSTISDNAVIPQIFDAFATGGGIANKRGEVTVINSTVSNNTANADTPMPDSISGGGISNLGNPKDVMDNNSINPGLVTLINATISGNKSDGDGGGISNNFADDFADYKIFSSTISNNTAATNGDGIFKSFGAVELTNTIVADNDFFSGDDCFPGRVVISLGHNVDSDGTCNLDGPTDLPGVDPMLGPLQNNGGPTMTHALLPGSLAIDHIPVVDCTRPPGVPLTTDQRGVLRPQGPECDVGAFEVEVGSADQTPPRCDVIGVVAGDLHVEVQDTGDGLKEINVLIADNATVNTPAFAVGTNAVITIVATKLDPTAPARVVIEAFDNSPDMNRSECDPILVSLTSQGPTVPSRQTFSGIPGADRYVTLYSEGPAFSLVTVNGVWTTVLTDGHATDIGAGLMDGQNNTVTLWSMGVDGSVMFSDVIPSNATGHTTAYRSSWEDLWAPY